MPSALLLAVIAAQVLTRPPELLTEVPAEYPAEALAAGGEATVLLELELDETGGVRSARVVESGGAAFDASALAAARRLVFRPAEVDGVPAAVRILYRTRFRWTAVERAPRLSGRIRDRWSKRALPGARVALDGVRTTTTSSVGRFRFEEVASGAHALELSALGYVTTGTTISMSMGRDSLVDYLLEPIPSAVDEEEVVRAPRLRGAVSQVAIAAAEARRIPGTQGDTLKVVQALPGVARAPLGSSALSVWGAAPDETKVLLDGVEIPALYHLGGVRSLVASELVDHVALTPAGQGAAMGRGLGGVIEVETRALTPGAPRAVLAADLLDVGGALEGALGDVRAAIAGRQSILHALVPALTDRDVGRLFPTPNYRDLGLLVAPSPRLDVLLLGTMDAVERGEGGATGVESSAQDVALLRARWRDESSSVVPSVVWTRRARRVVEQGIEASEATRELAVGLRASHRARLAEGVTLALGLDARVAQARVERTGSLTIPAREGDPTIFGRAPSDAVASDAWSDTAVDVAPHASLELRWGPLEVTPGLRVDLFGADVSRLTPRLALTPAIGRAAFEPRVAPRLAAVCALVPGTLELRGAVGLYHQAPEPEATSAVFGNPRVGVASGAHALLAVTVSPWSRAHAELTGFARTASDRVARTTLDAPLLAQVLTDEGRGRAAGAQVLVRWDPPTSGDGAFGWLSYTLLRSERSATADGAWRRADFDRTHALSWVAGYGWGAWSAGARLRWTSGAPRTEVVGRYYDARRDAVVPVLGPAGAATLPAFFQLDLRVDRAFELGWGRLAVGLELQNVTAHENVEAIAYRADYRAEAPVTGLPLLAVLGARLEL